MAVARASLRVAIVGSSVALGPREGGGWAQYLSVALRHRYGDCTAPPYPGFGASPLLPLPFGCAVENYAESGATTTQTLRQFAERCVPLKPHIIIIGLSLGNQGMCACSLFSLVAMARVLTVDGLWMCECRSN
jgi:hypothetical protein